MFPLHTILIAADFSACSEEAFHLAGALARDHGARLLVLHVATPPPLVTPGELDRALDQADGLRANLELQLRRVYRAAPPVRLDYSVVHGDPAAEIVRLAQAAACDLVVTGTHGRTGLERLLMGSVAENVVRRAPCPVVTVRASRHDEPPPRDGGATTDMAP
jgi:nucleotide-binding universal stress UspA family protein